MKAIAYRIRLLEPALVSELAGDPNSAVAFDYIPGSVLRGVFVRSYLKSHPGGDLAVDVEARRWFFSGETRWLNAYPLDRSDISGKRSLPVPRSLQYDKNGDENEIFDLAVEEPKQTEEFQPKWERVGTHFGQIIGDKLGIVQTRRQISVHTARTRRYGRARGAEQKIDENKGDTRGAVYRCDALAAGEVFAAVVLCPDGDAPQIKRLLDAAAAQTVSVGKSQTGGYGQAKIEQVSGPKAIWEEYAWPEFLKPGDADVTPQSFSGDLVVTLLSDALLRDEATGQFTVESEVFCRSLRDQLGDALKCKCAFLDHTIHGGFNRKWGLPLPQAQALAAGSVIAFEVRNVAPQKMIALLERGIGARRAEGFGRLAFNWQAIPKFKLDKTEPEPPPIPDTNLTGTSEEELARRVSNRILRRRLERRVIATGLKFSVDTPPHKSQLARLRGLVQDELLKLEPERSLANVVYFINRLKDRNATRRQFTMARVSATPLDEWLIEQLAKLEDAEWRGLLGLDATQSSVSIGGVIAQPTEQMKQEYLLRWLAAFLTRTAKQKGSE